MATQPTKPARAASAQLVLKYGQTGWRVFPVYGVGRNGKCQCGNPNCKSVGKHPRLKDWQELADTNELKILAWADAYPGGNWGLVTGATSGLVALDIDPKNGGLASYDQLQARFGKLPPTLTQRTGSGGFHYLFNHPGGRVPNKANLAELPGVDIRGDGGFIVIAPSGHASGERYSWYVRTPPRDLPDDYIKLLQLAEVTQVTQAAFAPVASAKDSGYWLNKALERASEGNRNETGFWLACQLRDNGFVEAEAEDLLGVYAQRAPGAGYSEREALASVRSAYKAMPRDEARGGGRAEAKGVTLLVPPSGDVAEARREYHQTQGGNAARFADTFLGRVLWVPVWKSWLIYNGKYWQRDERDGVIDLGREMVAELYRIAGETAQDDDWKFAAKSDKLQEIKGMLTLAGSDPRLAARPGDFDSDPYLLNVNNGTIDLKTMTLRAHNPEDRITKFAPVDYTPEATAPTWRAFIQWASLGRDDLAKYLRRAVGYSLIGSVEAEALFMLYGTGANGKSTFVETLRAMLGTYACGIPAESLMITGREGGPNNDIARLKGARFVAASEGDESARLNAALVKKLTSNEEITARFLNAEFFEFAPTHTLFFSTNYAPQIRDMSNGMWRRIRLVPFEAQLAEENETPTEAKPRRDDGLRTKLLAELSGILQWALVGCMEYQDIGIKDSPEVANATSEYRADSDVLAQFMEECCVINPQCRVAASELYRKYVAWCEEYGYHPINPTRFGGQLRDKGFDKERNKSGNYRIGIGIRA